MYKDKIQKTQNYYDGIAKGYFELYHQEQKEKILKVLSYIPKKGQILDLGSGDGVFNDFVKTQVKVVSLDLSFNLLNLNSNKYLINASILNLPIKSNSFNFIVSFSVFQDLPSIEDGVKEVFRILKKEGILIVSFLHVSSKANELVQIFEKEFNLLEKIIEAKDIILVLKK